MALLDLIDISKQYETQKILEKISLFINEKERIAIIGKNGGGKSTLLKIINNSLEVDSGRRILTQNISVEMLEQSPNLNLNFNVREAIIYELKEINLAKEKLNETLAKISKDPQNKELQDEQIKLSNFLDTHDAWNIDNKIEQVLQVFNLQALEKSKISSLSGGERRRVALAGLILKKPDILLLDEPTNHLDVQMVEFLEQMLLKGGFTIVFISHDRYFIDQIATRTIEIDNLNLRSFEGGYSEYLRAKEQILKSLEKQHDVLIKHLKSEEEWLRRGVKARLKRNEGRKQRVFELREAAKKNPSAITKMKLELERATHNFNQTSSVNRQKMLFEVKNLSKSLGEKELIKNFNIRILQQEKIAIVGKNGSGKSTLLQLLLGDILPDSGVIKKGDFLIGYFDQQRAMLDDEKSLIETFCPNGGDRVEVRGKNMHVFGYLKSFLFPKEYLDKQVGILSGGEKNRVALALLFTKNVDCLILDEPTNDLDILTINILEDYLLSFNGALIFVSHDRYFVDKIAKKLLIFKGDGNIEESYQSYSEYLEFQSELNEYEQIQANLDKQTQSKQKQKPTKLSYKEQKDYEELPKQIESLENEIKELNLCLSDPECYKEMGLESLANTLNEKEEFLESLVERYLEIEEKIESFSE